MKIKELKVLLEQYDDSSDISIRIQRYQEDGSYIVVYAPVGHEKDFGGLENELLFSCYIGSDGFSLEGEVK